MSNKTSAITIPIICRGCGNRVEKTLGWVKSDGNFVCDCGRSVTIKADSLIEAYTRLEEALDAFRNGLDIPD